MKIEIPLTQVQQFLLTNYHINIAFKNIGADKIEVKYFVSMVLTIMEVKKDEIVLRYQLNGFVNLLVKGAHFLFRNKLKDAPFDWKLGTREIIVNVMKVPALSSFVKLFYISEMHFVNESILLVLNSNEDEAIINK